MSSTQTLPGPCGAEFLAGTIAGVASKVVDFPFDTVKVRLQAANSEFASARHCIRTIARRDGLRGFYSGVAAPIAGTAAVKATFFSSYTAAIAQFSDTPTAPSLFAVAAAGAVGGVCAASVVTPTELVKCRVQHSSAAYSGVADCIMTTLRREGPAGFFRGHVATLWRGGLGNSVWMTAYEASLAAAVPAGGARSDLPWYVHGGAGGMAGLAFWGLMLPVDTVKTRMQTDASWQRKGFVRAFRDSYTERGVSGLYRGLAVTSLRAVIGNATVFMMYELVRGQWSA